MNTRIFFAQFTIPLTLLLVCQCWNANADGLIEAFVEYNFNETRVLFAECCPMNSLSGGHEDSTTKGSRLCSSNCSLHLELCLTATRQSSNFSRPPSDCILGRSSQPITIDSPDSVKLSVPVEGSSWLMEFDGILRIVKEYKNKSRSVLAESRWTENNLIKTLPPTSVPSDLGSNFVHLNTVMRTPLGESIPMSLHYRLRCKRHFYGQGCGVFCHGQRGTHGNYECDPNTGHIVCLDGWRGDRCTEAICEIPCEHGTCQEPNYCRCDSGWYGKSCEKCHVYPGCVHGTCERNRTTHSLMVFTCSCEPGWGGMLCDIDLNFCSRHPGICQNSGQCVNNQRHTDGFHHCHCRQGYKGKHCELREVDCRTQGCNGAGRCVKQQDYKHACQCSPGRFGDLCESTQPIAEPILSANGSEFSGSEKDVMQKCTNNTCLNGGLCSELPRSLSCKCPQGFGGHRCESNLCGCGKSQDCLAKCMNTTQHPETTSDYWNLDPDIKHITVHQHSSGWGDILTFVIVATLLGSSLVVLLCFTLCWFRNRKRDLPFGLASNCGYCAIQNEPFQTFNNQLENDVSCHVSVAKLSQPQTTELDTHGFLPTSKATDHRPCETDSGHHKSKLTSTWIDVQQLFTDIHSNPTKVAKQHMGVMR